MKTKAAVVFEAGRPMEIVELDLDGPRENEVLIRYTHAGLCHSDLHIVNGDLKARLPMVMGHEGAGVIEEVGPGVTRVQPGDHVVCSYIPACGTCHWCATGRQAICDWGATILQGCLPGGRFPMTIGRKQFGGMCMLGTFSQYGTLHQNSVVRIDQDLPLDKASLVGCGVPTGWGSAVVAGDVRPGETVIVAGIGGIGINAVQGARMAGASTVIAVDPLANKRETALALGATHAFATMPEAADLGRQRTNGNGAEKVILVPGLVTEEIVQEGFDAIGKFGTLIVTGVSGPFENRTVRVSGSILTFFDKTVKGTSFGHCNPTTDIPKLLNLYRLGDLKLDELITTTYSLEDINQGYEDLVNGKNIRGVVVHEH